MLWQHIPDGVWCAVLSDPAPCGTASPTHRHLFAASDDFSTLLRGEVTFAFPRTLAAWATKSAMVFEQLMPSNVGIYYTQSERRAFLDPPHHPPEQTFIDLGVRGPITESSAFVSTRMSDIPPSCVPARMCGFFFGHVAIRAHSNRLFDDPARFSSMIPVRPPRADAMRIHPGQSSLFWPPTHAVLDSDEIGWGTWYQQERSNSERREL